MAGEIKGKGWFFLGANQPLEQRDFSLTPPGGDEVVVEVAGCGLCHTDLTFFAGAVKTRKLPLILGHEISGTVIAAGSQMAHHLGKVVVIPAVLPCGDCYHCGIGRENICQNQKMPGNDIDGGFASHIKVPGKYLARIPDPVGGLPLSHFSVIADAVTTPYQSLIRSGAREGDVAIVVGCGGIGLYLVQHLVFKGCHVFVLDIDDQKLAQAREVGARFTLNTRGIEEGEVRKTLRKEVGGRNLYTHGWRIFETSGTTAGQKCAFSLLNHGATLGIVGYTAEMVTIRLSNMMAFDADLFGNWGCRPQYYPELIQRAQAGRLQISPFVQTEPLASINEVFAKGLKHHYSKRVILVP